MPQLKKKKAYQSSLEDPQADGTEVNPILSLSMKAK